MFNLDFVKKILILFIKKSIAQRYKNQIKIQSTPFNFIVLFCTIWQFNLFFHNFVKLFIGKSRFDDTANTYS